MATIKVNNHTVLTYEHEGFQEEYWQDMSKAIEAKYGRKTFTDAAVVSEILNDCFDYFLHKFSEIIIPIDKLSFYNYCFFLHEESLEILLESRKDFKLSNHLNEADFARYRRILKLILEQGCDKLLFKKRITQFDFLIFDLIIQKLFYLGTWLYSIADHIAYQKMLKDAKSISFDGVDMVIEWKNNFGKLYQHLFMNSYKDYEKALSDNSLIPELIQAINDNYNIDYNFACGIIFEIQKFHSQSVVQTIEPYVLPINLNRQSGIDIPIAKQFYDGLSLTKKNKMSIVDCILKPYSTRRYLFRSILVYNIEGKERAFVSKNKLAESIYVLASNAILWNTLPDDWLLNSGMQKFINKKGNEHDKILEDRFQQAFQIANFKFARNVKSLKTSTPNNINIDNSACGEIDFIILNEQKQEIVIADSKYNKARYEAIGYRADYTNFEKYELQLERKILWIEQNKETVQSHFRKIYNNQSIEIANFSVTGAFFINTPTFYMYNSKFNVVPVSKIHEYLEGIDINPPINITYDGIDYNFNYPYFTI